VAQPPEEQDKDYTYVVEKDPSFSIEHITSTDPKKLDKVYLDALEEAYQRGDPPGPYALQARLQEMIAEPGITNQKQWLLDMIAQKWATLSNTEVVSAAFGGQNDDLGNPVTENSMVWYLHIACRSDPDTDGVVTEVRNNKMGGPKKKLLGTSDKAPPKPSKSNEVVSTYGTRNKSKRDTSSEPPAKKPKPFPGDDGKKRTEPELAAPTVVLPAPDPGPPVYLNAETGETGFYLYAKKIADETAPHTVVAATEQQLFIRHLHRQVIELVKQFDKNTEESVAFQPGDEMYTWFETSVNATALSARGKDTEVFHFDLKTSLLAGSTIALEFSTDAIPLQFGITPANLITDIPISENWGTVKKYPIMIFALAPLSSGSQNPKITTKNLYSSAGFDSTPLFDVDLELIHPVSGSDKTLNRRNAVWFQPCSDYKTTLRLNFAVVELANLNTFLQSGSIFGDNFQLKTADVVLKRNATYKITQGKYNAQIESTIAVVATAAVSGSKPLEFSLIMVVSDGGAFQTILDFDEGADIGAVLDWLAALMGIDSSFTDWLNGEWMAAPKLSRVMLEFLNVNNKTTFINGTVTFQVDFKWGTETPEEKAVFFFSYSWPPGRLSGSLWPGKFRISFFLRPKFLFGDANSR
jgi:hypothetical protein